MIRTDWVGWDNKDVCPLCKKEGKNIANVYKKGHARKNGAMLESGISYCEDCADTPECEEHWNNWWQSQLNEQEDACEKNWREHGVYTNIGGHFGAPSFYFGYAKTPYGLERYLDVYPDCPRYKLETDVKLLHRNCSKNEDIEECRKKVAEVVRLSDADDKYKAGVIEHTEYFFKFIKEYWDAIAKKEEGSS